MDSPAAAPTLLRSRPSALSRALLVAAFMAYAVFLAFHMGAHAGGSDSSGYLNSARLLAHGATAMPQRIPAGLDPEKFDWFTFMPLGFRSLPRQQMAPTYPIGLPLGLAATASVTGWRLAPPIIMLASALAAIVLMIPLGRAAGLPRGWSLFGALLFGASPLTTFMSVQLMSDIPATAAATATILCAWQSRTRRRWALLAGVLLAIGVLIRPSNLILIAPVALCLGFDWRRWLLLGLGGLPGAVTQLIYSAAAYGNPLASGYGGDLATKFSFGIILATLAHYLRWLPILLTPAGLAAIALPWFGRRSHFAWVLVTWIAVIFGFYVSYWHTHETWWYLRFVLPRFPPASSAVSGSRIIFDAFCPRPPAPSPHHSQPRPRRRPRRPRAFPLVARPPERRRDRRKRNHLPRNHRLAPHASACRRHHHEHADERRAPSTTATFNSCAGICSTPPVSLKSPPTPSPRSARFSPCFFRTKLKTPSKSTRPAPGKNSAPSARSSSGNGRRHARHEGP